MTLEQEPDPGGTPRPRTEASEDALQYSPNKLARDLASCRTEEEVVELLVGLGLPREQAASALQLALCAQKTASTSRPAPSPTRSPCKGAVSPGRRAQQPSRRLPAAVETFRFPILEDTPDELSPALSDCRSSGGSGMQSAFATCATIPELELSMGDARDASRPPWLAMSVGSGREASLSEWGLDLCRARSSPRLTVSSLDIGRVSSLDEWISNMPAAA